MALIHHVSDVSTSARFPLEKANLVENAEDLIRIDRTHGQIIIGVAAIVEVKAAEHILGEEPGHDLLDVLRCVMMSGVNQDFGLRARST